MQKASPGVVSKLPSSFPHAEHSAAEAGLLKDALEWERRTVVELLCGFSLCKQLPDLACPCRGRQFLTSNQKYFLTHAVHVYKKHKNKFQIPCST